MNVLVVGKGGREHALVWKLAQSQRIDKLYVAPGNPGMASLAECVDIRVDTPVAERDKLVGEIERLVAFAHEQQIGLTVVGPDDALAGGIVDRFRASGLAIFGPTEAAARIESSKVFAKDLMERVGVPTARHQSFTDSQAASAYIREQGAPIVVKASGLAAGKGAIVCHSVDQALAAVHDMLDEGTLGGAGHHIVVEEYMVGEEASLFAICDGEHFITLTPAQDHKPIYDGDKGPNTGGMGAYAPAPVMTPALVREAEERVIQPVLAEMRRLGTPYQGVLYCGLMCTDEGVKVVEFNARFGDPECQILMPLLKTDLVDVLTAACDGRLDQMQVEYASGAAVCVVMASDGYPQAYEKGLEIRGLEAFADRDDIVVFHAGTAQRNGSIITDGGRVLCVTAADADIQAAVAKAYSAVDQIAFDNAYCRRDIAYRALAPEALAMPSDALRLRNMRFFAYHGLFPEETALGQHYEVDVELYGDFRRAGRSDDIDAAINYPEVYALVADVVTGEPCKLVEALAERIAEKVGTHCAPVELVVRVRKPNPPVAAHFDGIEVEIRRSYA